jgi:putative oxidoreductase
MGAAVVTGGNAAPVLEAAEGVCDAVALAIEPGWVTAVARRCAPARPFGPPGYETDLLYLVCLAALVVGGSGPLALGGLIANRLRKTFV